GAWTDKRRLADPAQVLAHEEHSDEGRRRPTGHGPRASAGERQQLRHVAGGAWTDSAEAGGAWTDERKRGGKASPYRPRASRERRRARKFQVHRCAVLADLRCRLRPGRE